MADLILIATDRLSLRYVNVCFRHESGGRVVQQKLNSSPDEHKPPFKLGCTNDSVPDIGLTRDW
jgi:hypothetical protein